MLFRRKGMRWGKRTSKGQSIGKTEELIEGKTMADKSETFEKLLPIISWVLEQLRIFPFVAPLYLWKAFWGWWNLASNILNLPALPNIHALPSFPELICEMKKASLNHWCRSSVAIRLTTASGTIIIPLHSPSLSSSFVWHMIPY